MNNINWELLIAACSVIFSTFLGVYQAAQNLKQKKVEFRWKKTEMAMHLIDNLLNNKKAFQALLMLDGLINNIEIPGKGIVKINQKKIISALDYKNAKRDNEINIIHRSFDALFYYLNRIENMIKTGFIEFEDTISPMEYYINIMANDKSTFENYIIHVKYLKVLNYFDRFDVWANPNRSIGNK